MSLVVGLRVGQVAIGLGEFFTDILSSGLLSLSSLEDIILEVLEVEIVDHKSGGDDVILVYVLHEGLNSGFLDELFLVDSSLDISRVAGDADQEQVWEFMFLS